MKKPPRERFGMHMQHGWEARAADPNLPDWFRVMSLGYARHRANGHANFDSGEIREALSLVNVETGELLSPKAASTVSRAIETAVARGVLAKGSRAGCLIVPGHVQGGLGNEEERCPIHDGRRRRAPERPL